MIVIIVTLIAILVQNNRMMFNIFIKFDSAKLIMRINIRVDSLYIFTRKNTIYITLKLALNENKNFKYQFNCIILTLNTIHSYRSAIFSIGYIL